MEKQKGFTLVELVVVIIILGILAVTAAPKFINMQSDAYASTLKGMQGAINGANTMVYAKAALQGVTASSAASVDIGLGSGKEVDTVFGYVKATKDDLEKVLDVTFDNNSVTNGKNEWIIDIKKGANIATITQRNAPKSDCNLIYKEAQQNKVPSMSINISGC